LQTFRDVVADSPCGLGRGDELIAAYGLPAAQYRLSL
jgi:hypothetical protein